MNLKAIFCTLLFLWVTCLSTGVLWAKDKTYLVGVVPQYDVRKIQQVWNPILARLEKKTKLHFKLVPSEDIPDFERQLKRGAFDLVYLNPYHLIVANKQQGYQPILRDHGKMLFGVLVVAKEGQITKLSQLEGETVAFPAPNALGASLLIRSDLSRKFGVSVVPRYVRSHSSVYLNVATGAAAAGGGVQKTFDLQPQEVRDVLSIIHQTTKVAPHPFAVHPRVGAADILVIKKGLLQMGQGTQGQALLKKIPIKKIGPAELSDYIPLNDLGLEQFYKK